jgi:hypothetical protein
MNSNHDAVAAGAGLISFLFIFVIALGFYVFFCYCCKRICEKAGHDPGVLIWIPIANLIPLLRVAGMAEWMILLFFIPLVNVVLAVMMWAKICIARGKTPWLVLLMFVPLLNIVLILYLAFAD